MHRLGGGAVDKVARQRRSRWRSKTELRARPLPRCRRRRPTSTGRPARRRAPSSKDAEAVARRYFEAIDARELEAAVGMWADGGREFVRGQADVLAPDGVREFIGSLLEAMPDMRMEVVADDDRGRSLRGAVGDHGHVRRARIDERSPADRPPLAARRVRRADRTRRQDSGERRLHRRPDRGAPDRPDAARRARPPSSA